MNKNLNISSFIDFIKINLIEILSQDIIIEVDNNLYNNRSILFNLVMYNLFLINISRNYISNNEFSLVWLY